MRVLALTLAYALILQLVLTGVLAARLAGQPSDSFGVYCLNGVSGASDGAPRGAEPIAHCPLCTPPTHAAIIPHPPSVPAIRRPFRLVQWRVDIPSALALAELRIEQRPRAPPAVS